MKMRLLKYILTIVACYAGYFGCTSCSRKVSKALIDVSRDSVSISVTHQSNDSFTRDRFTLVRDTAIGIAGGEVKDTLAPELLSPATTGTGVKVPVHYEKSINGLTAWVNILPDGRLEYGAQSDSITMVVRGLIRSNDSLRQTHSAESDSTAAASHERYIYRTKTVVKTRVPAWLWITGALLLVLEIYLRFFAPPVLKNLFRKK